MPSSTLIIGGCRSGKSSQALAVANQQRPERKLFVATCVPQDPEMQARVDRHKQERDGTWQTVETPLDLADTLDAYGDKTDLILIDCLTLWISNLMMVHESDDAIHAIIDDFCERLHHPSCSVLLVTNEVGAGIVPENDLARRYRDLVGKTNQKVAAACRRVVWMVAGIPVTIKPPVSSGTA